MIDADALSVRYALSLSWFTLATKFSRETETERIVADLCKIATCTSVFQNCGYDVARYSGNKRRESTRDINERRDLLI